jgi:DNA-binding MarR family transcriptional regulator
MPETRLDNRPLLGRIDQDLFIPPAILPALTAAANRRLNVLMLGAPGSGKTTLLRAIVAMADDAEFPSVFVDLNPAKDAAQALSLIADALGRQWSGFGDSLAKERTLATQAGEYLERMGPMGDPLRWRVLPEESETGRLLRLTRQLGRVPASRLVIDSPPGQGEAFTLFGRLRDELWQLGHQWILAADEIMRDEFTRPPANAFFDVQLDLTPLSESEQREFYERRLASDPEVDVDALVGKTDGLPRSLLELARSVVLDGGNVDEVLARRNEIQARLERLPPAAARVMAYLADHGPTSGSDKRLLATLGVSGQRARQVLRELEADGLVRSFPRQQKRQGRPRKLYELDEALR